MRKLFDEMRIRFEGFLAQRDQLTLVVRAGLSEYAAVLRTLQGIEQGDSPHLFAIFAEPFEEPTQYAQAIIDGYRAQHEALVVGLQAAGQPAPPVIPELVLDARQPAVARVRALCVFARRIVPDLDSSCLVVAFIPHAIKDPVVFARFVTAVMQHEFPIPWCHHIRFIVRDDAAAPVLGTHGQELPRAAWYAPDLGTAAIERSFEDDANDESLPVQQRMQSLLVLAGMDTAYERIPAAIEKYSLLAEHYLGMGNLPFVALSLNGIGEAYARANQPAKARQHFERALTPAVQAEHLPTLVTIMFNLANLHRGQNNWIAAIEHYGTLSVLARATLNASLQLVCHEQAGFCLYKAGAHTKAIEQWTAGITLAKGTDMPDQQVGFLTRMRDLFAELGMYPQQRDIDRQLRALNTEISAAGVS